jgi:hypothetical protein
VDEDPLRGKRGLGRLLAVLGWGELLMLTAAALGAITLLYYLTRVLEGGPAVLTPTARVQAVASATVGR